MRYYIIIFICTCIINNVCFARQGFVKLKNGHTLAGDIHPLPQGDIRITRRGSSIYFTRDEIHSIHYEKKSLIKKKDDLAFFIQALKNTPAFTGYDNDTFDYLIYRASQKVNLDSALIKAVVEVESGFNPNGVSHKGAQGLMQLMPGTALSLGVKDVFNPEENIFGGSRYLRKMYDKFDGNMSLALAAYNAGPHAVKKYGKIPPYRETKQYVKKVLERYRYNKREPRFYEYRDKNGCLYLSNYLKNDNYKPVK